MVSENVRRPYEKNRVYIHCKEGNPECATILQASLDGKHRSVFASGLRDPIGWSWHPQTHEMWEVDHGIDWLGDDLQPEELNHIEKGKNYGWPYIYGDNQINPRPETSNDITKQELKKTSVPMVLGYTAHAAPMQMAFYNANQFPPEYKGDAFVSMHGSWNRKTPSGYEVLRIKFNNGKAEKFEPFVTGFLTSKGESGRPVGNIVSPDGSLLFTDDRNGVIYRVSYIQGNKSPNQANTPIPKKNVEKKKSPLANVMLNTKSLPTLKVTSKAFQSDARIPVQYSAFDQNASVPLQWSEGPQGTKSYVVMVEDPDAQAYAPELPVVHWTAWNIPAPTVALPEGLSNDVQLSEPKGMRQGYNSNGKIGYTGPRPPEENVAHRYYFQVFAVDRQLDLPLGAKREELIAALQKHVLASGSIMGTFKKPEHPAKP